MATPKYLNEADHDRITAAVAEAELLSSGEIVTILADRSDGYTDVALAWAAFVGFLALGALALAPQFYMGLYDLLIADWGHEWTPRMILSLALGVVAIKFGAMLLLQLWQPLKFFLIPAPIRTRRVHDRAMRAYRIGAEKRTTGRTGILIYLSMREHRVEILADEAIASKVEPGVWADAINAMLAELRQGRTAEAMVAGVGKVGAILSLHVPRLPGDVNELPDRLIEV
ncbi:TPM domain-containing protein [Novosphingobium kaempferiae]|uniref:TPM domain-containing protein n=1 Tax=Novosphingobium kaempferiae TaxID=2896849 RepID=UPI001E45872D|nr:TPM domain-containing protein [Novosphingobium kaempferiae]